MFKWWDNYLERKYAKIEEAKRLEIEELEREELKKREHEEKLAQELLDAKYTEKKKSSDPWMEIISEEWSAEHGLSIKMDWNNAMVKFLKANNFTGETEEDIIYSYVRALSADNQREEIAKSYVGINEDDENYEDKPDN